MRAVATVEFRIERFDAWRAALCALAVAGVVSLTAWAVSHVSRGTPDAVVVLTFAGVGTVLVGLLARAATQNLTCLLQWDGRSWWCSGLDEDVGTAATPVPGRLALAIDLGNWMLLRFEPDASDASPRRVVRPRWVPAQRRGLENQWHALRCAVCAGAGWTRAA